MLLLISRQSFNMYAHISISGPGLIRWLLLQTADTTCLLCFFFPFRMVVQQPFKKKKKQKKNQATETTMYQHKSVQTFSVLMFAKIVCAVLTGVVCLPRFVFFFMYLTKGKASQKV